jgi:hypothetical protein
MRVNPPGAGSGAGSAQQKEHTGEIGPNPYLVPKGK